MKSVQINGRWVNVSGTKLTFAELVTYAFGDHFILPTGKAYHVVATPPQLGSFVVTPGNVAPAVAGLRVEVTVVDP